MTRRLLAGITLLVLASGCEPCFGGTLELTGDLGWTGAPTSETGTTWPATVEVMFDPSDWTKANVHLDSSPYSGSWMLDEAIMTSGNTRFFGNSDGTVRVDLEMLPLSDLSTETLANIVNLEFSWAHPLFNDPAAPTSWLTLEGAPAVVPEPSTWPILLGLLAFLFSIIRLPA